VYTTRTHRVFHTDAQGNITLQMGAIASVGIADLAQVQSHQINHVAGSTSHVVHFAGGGRLCYAYNGRGQIIEVSAWHVMVHLGPENQCIFSALA
jgi:hypothetical protein